MHKRAQSQELTVLMICIEVFFLRQYYFTWNGQEVAPGLKNLQVVGRNGRHFMWNLIQGQLWHFRFIEQHKPTHSTSNVVCTRGHASTLNYGLCSLRLSYLRRLVFYVFLTEGQYITSSSNSVFFWLNFTNIYVHSNILSSSTVTTANLKKILGIAVFNVLIVKTWGRLSRPNI